MTINKIRRGAADLFRILGLRDVARIDGWLLPQGQAGESSSGTVVFSDINLVRHILSCYLYCMIIEDSLFINHEGGRIVIVLNLEACR